MSEPTARGAFRRKLLERGTSFVGVFALTFIAVVGNVLAARHFTRWDFTSNQKYTLSRPTLETLHELPEPVRIWLTAGSGDTLGQSVRQLLVAYEAASSRIEVRVVDPDRDVGALEDLRRRFRIETGRTQNGAVVTDAIAIVESGDRHWFVRPGDLVDVSEAEDGRVRPRQEEAFTLAIRNVVRNEKALLCFTTGHGELGLEQGGESGLAPFKALLEKNNFDVRIVDTTKPDQATPFDGCLVAVVAGPRAAFTEVEAERLRTFLMLGGNLFAAVGPPRGRVEEGVTATGLEGALAPFGIVIGDAVIVETDPSRALPNGRGLQFFAAAREHSLTSGLSRLDDTKDAPRVLTSFARPLRAAPAEGATSPIDLLVTSSAAFGLRSIEGASNSNDDFERPSTAPSGPFVLAMLGERAKVTPSASHGPRAFVVGTSSVLTGASFQSEWPIHGAATLVENAMAWLASRPALVDIPVRATAPAAIRIAAESKSSIRMYVLVYMPLSVLLLGLAVLFRRKSTEGRPFTRPGR